MRSISKIIGALFLFFLITWWAVTGMGVLYTIGQILQTSLLGWQEKEGILKLYLLLGSISVIGFMLWVAFKSFYPLLEMLKDGINGIIELTVTLVIFGSTIILIIPLVTIGWPLLLWFIWPDTDPAYKE